MLAAPTTAAGVLYGYVEVKSKPLPSLAYLVRWKSRQPLGVEDDVDAYDDDEEEDEVDRMEEELCVRRLRIDGRTDEDILLEEDGLSVLDVD